MISLLGTLVLAPILIDYLDDQSSSLGTSWTVGLAVPGIVLTLWGDRMRSRAHDALSRAVWWHNRELPR